MARRKLGVNPRRSKSSSGAGKAKTKGDAKAPAKKETAKASSSAKASTAKASTAKSSASKATASTSASKDAATKKAPPAPNLPERMEGLQGWMAELERKQTRMTRFGGGAAILATVLAAGGLALGVLNKQDSAEKEDVDQLREQVEGFQAEVKTTTEDQLNKLNARIGTLEQSVQNLTTQQQQNSSEIASLKAQAARGAAVPAVPGAKP